MNRSWQVSRRTVLRGLGATLAIPWLESMVPSVTRGADELSQPPKHMAFVYVPNGVHMADWTPAGEGEISELSYILEPLKPFKSDLMVHTGLVCDKARPHGNGPGDHARAMAAFLTGAQPKRTSGETFGQASLSTRWRPSGSANTRGFLRSNWAAKAGYTPATATRVRVALTRPISPGGVNRLRTPRKSIRGWF